MSLAAVLFGSLLSSAGAWASTASMNDGALTYAASAGETNHVLIVEGAGNYRIVDSGATITPGAGCSTVANNEVVCSIPENPTITGVTVGAGDLNDFVAVTAFHDTTVFGDAGGDTIEVSSLALNLLDGGPGNDTLLGGGGDCKLVGGDGADILSGESRVSFFIGTAIADYSARTNPVTADVDGVADDGEVGEGDNVIAVDRIDGGSAGDTLTGFAVFGRDGNDTLVADPSANPSTDSDASPQARGGRGDDTLTWEIQSAGFAPVLDGGVGNDTLTAGPGDGGELAGGRDDDLLTGGADFDDLFGGAGDDTLLGGGSRDLMFGDSGEDIVAGGAGRDFLSGGSGDDTLRARDGQRDDVRGGPDHDRARIDRGLDHVSLVEVFF